MLRSPEIAKLEEHRQALAVAELSNEAIWIAGGSVCFSGEGSWTNQAQGLGHNGPVTSDDIDQLVDFYVTRGVEPKIEVTAFADESLLQELERHGFTTLEFENVWGKQLQDFVESAAVPSREVQPDLKLSQVNPTDEGTVNDFAQITASGFGTNTPTAINDVKRTVAHPRSISLLASLNDIPVGAAGMEISDEIACLFGATVLPAYRRQGIQAALILERLNRAAAAGCQLAVIHSNPGIATERTAQKMGFTLAYSKVILRMMGEGLVASP